MQRSATQRTLISYTNPRGPSGHRPQNDKIAAAVIPHSDAHNTESNEQNAASSYASCEPRSSALQDTTDHERQQHLHKSYQLHFGWCTRCRKEKQLRERQMRMPLNPARPSNTQDNRHDKPITNHPHRPDSSAWHSFSPAAHPPGCPPSWAWACYSGSRRSRSRPR